MDKNPAPNQIVPGTKFQWMQFSKLFSARLTLKMILIDNFSLYIIICQVGTLFKSTGFELNSSSKALKTLAINDKLLFKFRLSLLLMVVTISQMYYKRGTLSIEETVVSWMGWLPDSPHW